jgi:hypothetical protein
MEYIGIHNTQKTKDWIPQTSLIWSVTFLFPEVSSKGETIVVGIVRHSVRLCIRAPVPNWFPDDNLRTKIRIEATCGMYMYLIFI